MAAERIHRAAACICAALLATGLLAACGADDEPESRNAAATTARTTTATTTTTAATSAAADAGAGDSGVDATGTASTPGVGDPGAFGSQTGDTNANSCSNAVGLPPTFAATGLDDRTTTTTTSTTTTATTTTPRELTDSERLDGLTTPRPSSASTSSDTTRDDETAREQVELERPFSSSSPWNTPIGTRPVDPRSAGWIAQAARRVAVDASVDQEGVQTTRREAPDLRLFVNTCAWTPAIVGEHGGDAVRVVCRQRNCGPVAKQISTLRVTRGIDPFPEFDGWYSVIDQSTGVGYDLWRARRVGDVISYQFIKRWRLDGPGFSPPATTDPVEAVGARGSGLPLFAGIIHPHELRQGRIDHALAISIPGPAQRVFTPPASVTNGVNVLRSLPEGARLRLKPGFRQRRLPRGVNRRTTEAIITALRTYGAIVVDRSITPTLYARRSSEYDSLLLGNEVQNIRLTDLEVLETSTLLRFPPLESTQEEVAG